MTADAITCEWQGGADKYTGSIAAAIASYGYPIDAWQRRQFTDSVVIDRDSIRGQAHDYEKTISRMHFGSAGRRCANVTREKWDKKHVETALVVCAGETCVAIPSACSNVFELTARARTGSSIRTVRDTDFGVAELIADLQLPGPVGVPMSLPSMAGADGSASYASSSTAAYVPVTMTFAGSSMNVSGTPTVCPECCYTPHSEPLAPVPEPETWAMLLAGLAALVWHKSRG
jgi:hypothetical protein